MHQEKNVYYYEIRFEDIGHCGITAAMVTFRRGVPTVKVHFDNEDKCEAVKKLLSNCKKQEARSQRCLIKGKKEGTLIVCPKCCKTCTEEDKKDAIQKPMLMCDVLEKLTPRGNAIEDFIVKDTVREILTKMNKINEKYARYLRYRLKEMSIQDIADVEGKAKSTVKETLDRAYALARKIYDGEI